MEQHKLADLARRQWDDYRARSPGTYFSEAGAELTLGEAYAVQRELARLRCAAGDEVAGFKVGCIGPAVVEQFGMRGPIHAHLFRSELRQSGDLLDHRNFCNLAIEGEMAVQIGPDGGIESMFPVVELHNFVFRGPSKSIPELVANNGINAGVVLSGLEVRAHPADVARSESLAVEINGDVVDQGPLWAMGSAEEAVSWLQGNLASQGMTLGAGSLVLTGTPLGLYPVKPGDRITVMLDGLEYVTCQVV